MPERSRPGRVLPRTRSSPDALLPGTRSSSVENKSETKAVQVTKGRRKVPFFALPFQDYPRNFRASTEPLTMQEDCVFRGGNRRWVNVSPNPDGKTLRGHSG